MAKNDTAGDSRIVNRVWHFFASMHLAIFLLFLLAILSIIGTIIPQGRAESFYLANYGATLSPWFLKLNLSDMYHSWWFSLLLAVFALNIIVCTIERFPAKWRLFKRGERDVEVAYMKTRPHYASFNLDNITGNIFMKSIRDVLRSRNYRLKEMEEGSSAMAIKGYKGRLNRFGSDIVHLGIIVILVGGIIGAITGFKEYKPIPVGETVKVDSVDFDLKIRANRFWIEHYDSGEVKQYYSDLTLIEDGKEILRNSVLYVNSPLIYKGIWFYQTSYGEAWDRVDDITLNLFDRKEDKKIGNQFKVKWQEMSDIPGMKGYAVKPIVFVSDFAIDTANKNWYAKSIKHSNPAIQVEVYKGGISLSKEWVFLNFPNIFPIFGQDNNHNLILATYTAAPYTALNVVRDRGVNIVWAGSILMLIGLFLSFFVHYRRIWVIIREEGKEITLHIAGSSYRDKISFEKEFSRVVEFIRNNM